MIAAKRRCKVHRPLYIGNEYVPDCIQDEPYNSVGRNVSDGSTFRLSWVTFPRQVYNQMIGENSLQPVNMSFTGELEWTFSLIFLLWIVNIFPLHFNPLLVHVLTLQLRFCPRVKATRVNDIPRNAGTANLATDKFVRQTLWCEMRWQVRQVLLFSNTDVCVSWANLTNYSVLCFNFCCPIGTLYIRHDWDEYAYESKHYIVVQ